MSQQIWQTLYPQSINIFVFSNGWFWRFLRRHNIVRRRITKMATKSLEEVVKMINCFIQYIRRNNRREDSWAATMLRSSPPFGKLHFLRKFPNYLIINLDETPFSFELLNGYLYDFKGVKTVAGKSERSSWNKRQAIIILYIMADGSTSFKPVVIFHGKGTIAKRESYDERVEIHFNKTVYNNEELSYSW
jgi:hypothetical protein